MMALKFHCVIFKGFLHLLRRFDVVVPDLKLQVSYV